MTVEEFEDYLVSIGGLKNGHYPDRPNIVTCLCSCGDGWLQLVHDLIEELIEAGWDKQIYQIKEKFGTLRFYIATGSNEIWEIIEKYEQLSEKTCENCGSEEDVTTTNEGWVRTLCSKCTSS